MKLLITVISSLLVGLALASSNFSPIHELQYFLGNKRRLLVAFGAAVTGYLFLFSAVLISLVEAGLQFDAQGFVMWSSLFTVSLLLVAAAGFSLVMARTLLPPKVEYRESLLGELNKQFNSTEAMEALVRKYAEFASAPREPAAGSATAEAEPPEARPDERFRETRRPRDPESVFRDTPTADVLHH